MLRPHLVGKRADAFDRAITAELNADSDPWGARGADGGVRIFEPSDLVPSAFLHVPANERKTQQIRSDQ